MVQLDVCAEEVNEAKRAYELLTVNLVIIHLFLSVALIKFVDIKLAVNIPIVLSLLIIAWTFFKVRRLKHTKIYFAYLHWRQTLNYYRLLIAAYLFYYLVIGIDAFLSRNSVIDSMDGRDPFVLITLLFAVMPLFFVILVIFVIGSGLMFNATRKEVSPKWLAKYPRDK